MANIVEVRNTIHSFGVLDANTIMSSPLQLPINNAPLKMQVCSLTLSDRIPNVFDANPYYAFNNMLCRVSTNLQPWQTIQIPMGLYPDPTTIGLAISSAIGTTLGWWTSNTDPGLFFEVNTITDIVTINIVSSKLKPAIGNQFTLDLRKVSTNTDLATTLGFSQATALMVGTGKYYSNQEVDMDTQGTTCDVQCSLVTSRRRNDTFVKTIALVVYAGKTSVSDNVWPLGGQISPIMVYDGNRNVKSVELLLKTLSGRPMFFMSGSVHLVISFIY
jgi:hypothetical protein